MACWIWRTRINRNLFLDKDSGDIGWVIFRNLWYETL